MANEGIMALPQGMPMQSEEPVDERPVVSSAQSYDAAQTVLKDRSPQEYEVLKEAMRQNLADIELSPNQLATVLDILVFMSQRPSEYVRLRQMLIDSDFLDAEDLPEEYDVEFIGAAISMLNELQLMQSQGAQAPMMDMPPVEGADAMQGLNGGQPLSMAQGGLADVAAYLASQGRNGDSILAHITRGEAQLLKDRGGAASINPVTGLPEYFIKKLFKGVGNAVKSVLKSPVGRILATVALAAVLGPAGVGLSLGSTAASSLAINAGLASAGVTLAGGGDIKQALIAGATGYFGGGGTAFGFNPAASLGSVLPGAAGSALNTGLSSGILGAGLAKLSGASTQDALKAGLIAGGSAAALSGLKDTSFGRSTEEQAARNDAFRRAYAGDKTTAGIGPVGPVEPVSAVGPVSTAPDLLAGDIDPNFYKTIGIDPSSMSTAGAGQSPSNIQIERDILGMTGPVDTARQVMSAGKDIYKDYFSPSEIQSRGTPGAEAAGTKAADAYVARNTDAAGKFTGTAALKEAAYQTALKSAMPGMFATYGPLAAAGTVAVSALGGFKSKPAEPDPIAEAEKERTLESNRRAKEREDFLTRGGFGLEKPVLTPYNPIVGTNFSSQIPVGPSGQIVPMGISNSPTGVAQPYNVAGMYGVPLLYGQGYQPQQMARGGEPKSTQFPRKTGPINGPGTGTSDDIPAMLSDGEFVFTAKAVRNAGSGSRRKGAARMYKLMKMLEGGPVKGN